LLNNLPPGLAGEGCLFLAARSLPEGERGKNSTELSRSYHAVIAGVIGSIAKVLREGYEVNLLQDGLYELSAALTFDYLLIDIHPVYWLLGSSVQKQAHQDGKRNPFPACKHRRVCVESDVVTSILMFGQRYSQGREKLLVWLAL